MSGISALGTTYNMPNYTGPLLGLTPAETPLLSAIGGLSGGGQVTSTEIEWQTWDMADAGQNVALEGADAPSLEGRVRANVTNVVQIQQRAVGVSYTKLAAVGLKSGTNNDLQNPVRNELDTQVEIVLKEMARDVNWSFINGIYQKPTDNTTKRQTRGLLAAISTNLVQKSTTVTGLSAATDTITETSTAVANGDKIIFTSVGASTAIFPARTYYVVSKSTNAFKVALTSGGSAITIGTATVAYRPAWTTTLDTTHVNGLLQTVYDNGGISEQSTAALLVNSSQKIALSAAYASAYGKFMEQSRTMGGVAMDTIVTDFGTLKVIMDRMVPQDTIIATSLEQLIPVFLEVPGKGHMFAEPLAKTGATDRAMIYGEVGLAYGSERAHGALTGLKN
jgi:hypothetical protein